MSLAFDMIAAMLGGNPEAIRQVVADVFVEIMANPALMATIMGVQAGLAAKVLERTSHITGAAPLDLLVRLRD